MSISKREAERYYPTQYWNRKNWLLKLLPLTTDDLQLAYQSGREAEPCKEEVQAAADTLNTFFCTCGPLDSIPTHHELKHLAALVLDAARNAVM